MKVEVLTTPGCTNCSVLEKMLDDLGVPYEVIDVTERQDYLQKYQIMTAPALVIDGKLEHVGIPKREKLAQLVS